jgi:hypothetical protein
MKKFCKPEAKQKKRDKPGSEIITKEEPPEMTDTFSAESDPKGNMSKNGDQDKTYKG